MQKVKSNPLEKSFSPSGLETACMRRFFLQRIYKLLPKGTNIAASFGSAIHSGVAEFYKNRDKMAAIAAFVKDWESLNIQGSAVHNLRSGILIMQKYCEFYKNDTTEYKKDLIECDQWVEMPNETRMCVVIDRVSLNGGIFFEDTKTTKSLTDYWFKKFETSFQFGAYDYTLCQIIGECDGIRVDAIAVPYKEDAEGFQRRSFTRTEVQRKEWLNSYIQKTNKIIEALKKVDALSSEDMAIAFPQESACCRDYGGCPYLPVCINGLDHPAIKEMYNIREE